MVAAVCIAVYAGIVVMAAESILLAAGSSVVAVGIYVAETGNFVMTIKTRKQHKVLGCRQEMWC